MPAASTDSKRQTGRVDRGLKYGYQFVTQTRRLGHKRRRHAGDALMQWRSFGARGARTEESMSRPVGVLAVAALAASAAGCSSLPIERPLEPCQRAPRPARPWPSNRSTARRPTCSASSSPISTTRPARDRSPWCRAPAPRPTGSAAMSRRWSSATRPPSPGSGTSTTPTSAGRCALPARSRRAAGKPPRRLGGRRRAGAPPHGPRRHGADRGLPQFVRAARRHRCRSRTS